VNVYEFVLGIILITTIGGAIRMYLKAHYKSSDGEADRLRAEVETLRDRLAVLERITVEKESSLEREIEQLRDR
jgi:regulator of replication initiation timing